MAGDADVLIVGAGHGGLAVAHELVREGRDVLLVDAHARISDAWRRLHFVRGRFLFAISRHARDVARDVRRSG